MRTLTVLFALLASCRAWGQIPPPTWQQQPQKILIESLCLPSLELMGRLSSLGEQPWITADIKNEQNAGGFIVMWVDPTNSNWTITATFGNISCMLSTGTGFKEAPQRPSL